MSEDKVIYRQKLHQIYEVPASDELVSGAVTKDYAEITGSGELKRGTLMMTSGDGFAPATKEGLASAAEIAILGVDKNISEGMTAYAWLYFSGTFKGSSIILAYETEEDTHEELLEEIRAVLRQKRFMIV